MDFLEQQLPGGIKLHIFPTTQFRTTLMQVFFHQPLNRQEATMAALVPAVLQRGDRKFPETLQLQRALEQLYGAQLNTAVLKKGEDQVLSFSLEIVDEAFTGSGEQILKKGWELLHGMICDPFLEGQAFKADYVSQEKEQLGKLIDGMVNDKTTYAVERCIQEMCQEEPYGVFKYGSKEDLPGISAQNLYGFYRRLLGQAVEIYIVGNVQPEEMASLLSRELGFAPSEGAVIPKTVTGKEPGRERVVEEKRAVSQGKLTLGYRTNVAYGDDDYYPLLVYNGILGGFPHSKLFQNVREQASLAYYAISRIVKHKGIMLIASGIEEENYEQAVEIIGRQVEALSRGEISDEELENTRLGLINQLQVQEDSPYSRIQQRLDAAIAGIAESPRQAREAVAAVTKEDVVRVAGKVKLDTVYFLHGSRKEADPIG